jgi:hypothetical protein
MPVEVCDGGPTEGPETATGNSFVLGGEQGAAGDDGDVAKDAEADECEGGGEAGVEPHVSARRCDAHGGRRGGHPTSPGDAGSCAFKHHADLHAREPGGVERSPSAVPPAREEAAGPSPLCGQIDKGVEEWLKWIVL